MAFAIPFRVRRTVGHLVPDMRRLPGATTTFKQGVPVMLNTSGTGIQEMTATATSLLGVSSEYNPSRAADGQATMLTYGDVLNQPNAVNIPIGAPIDDGTVGIYMAEEETRFEGKVGTAADTPVAIPANWIELKAGLTKDSNGFWFVDTTKNTTTATVRITNAIDPVGTVGGKVEFIVLAAARQQEV